MQRDKQYKDYIKLLQRFLFWSNIQKRKEKMSTYSRMTKHPVTGEWDSAVWHDNYYAPHQYGVEFSDGYIADPSKEELETRDKLPGDPKNPLEIALEIVWKE